jgi:pimeloyl-ACP methyl ester carboxylesterase
MQEVSTQAAPDAAPRRQYEERVVPFRAGDGFECNVINVRGEREPTKGPVMLVHGAGVRANLFRSPVRTTFVDYLIEHGYDVWMENWRASIDFPANHWTLDQAAVYDHPEAVKTIVRETGADEVKAVIHCQGSCSFIMSAMAGLVPQVKTVVTNAVSLHTVVPSWSGFKLRFAVPFINRFTDYLDPQWGIEAPTLTAKAVNALVRLTHHECDNAVCKQVSFTYGAGFPALWRHENLNEDTHEWLKREFAKVPLTFFRQMAQCVRKGHLISVEGRRELPADFTAQEPQTDARFAFFAGAKNLCFLPESQQRSYDFFNRLRPNYHSLHVFPEYGHLDVFMGANAARDTYPLLLAELERPR